MSLLYDEGALSRRTRPEKRRSRAFASIAQRMNQFFDTYPPNNLPKRAVTGTAPNPGSEALRLAGRPSIGRRQIWRGQPAMAVDAIASAMACYAI